ncbi:fumarylacetoacetate hydrolase family protein [Pseudomonas sp. NA-150]|uniref:fumarylacetoacetate hydrolase family protein n=1 Tax=Pseudomonas sp. NA-150 TaxID=3367525 RepID=UPI0037CAD574
MNNYVFPPLPQPRLPVQDSTEYFPVARVFCMGRNYWWPEALVDGKAPEREAPFFFMKPAHAIAPAHGHLPFPSLTAEFCPEIELVIAIGKDGSDIAEGEALNHVWGYAAGLDMTRRDIQMAAKAQGRPWESSKAFEHSAPATAIVPVSKIGHPTSGALWLQVNGVDRQRSNLANQIWSVAEVVSRISQSIGLKAGDLIFTGTPAGVESIQAGDVVTAGIEGIGQLSVTVATHQHAFS